MFYELPQHCFMINSEHAMMILIFCDTIYYDFCYAMLINYYQYLLISIQILNLKIHLYGFQFWLPFKGGWVRGFP